MLDHLSRTPTTCSILALLLLLLAALPAFPATAAGLDVAEVSAPDINCVFDSDCTITVSDFVDTFPVPAASGDARIQSRTQPPGEAGTPGDGLYAYEYRVNLTRVAALTAVVCVDELRVDFGPVESLDYDGDGRAEQVYVVTRGGLGSVRPSSAEQTGGVVTFRFQPGVCPGNRAGDGDTSFFFGLASEQPPTTVSAQVGFDRGSDLEVSVKAPEEGDMAPPSERPGCEVGIAPHGPVTLPIPEWTPACRCVQDPGGREFRCAMVHPDLIAVWRVPSPAPRFEPFEVEWTLVSVGGPGAASVRMKTPAGFERVGRKGPAVELPQDSPRNVSRTGSAWLVSSGRPGEHRLEAELALPGGPNRPAPLLEIRVPLVVGESR